MWFFCYRLLGITFLFWYMFKNCITLNDWLIGCQWWLDASFTCVSINKLHFTWNRRGKTKSIINNRLIDAFSEKQKHSTHQSDMRSDWHQNPTKDSVTTDESANTNKKALPVSSKLFLNQKCTMQKTIENQHHHSILEGIKVHNAHFKLVSCPEKKIKSLIKVLPWIWLLSLSDFFFTGDNFSKRQCWVS